MASAGQLKALARARMADEVGPPHRLAPEPVALVYPSPYRAAMSSLGFLQIARLIDAQPGRSAERAFLPDDVEAHRGTPLFTYESMRPVSDFPVIAMSVAFELELAGVIETLRLSGLAPLARERDRRAPFVLAGGPLTFSNPLPLAPFVDAILMGEAEETIGPALDVIFGSASRDEAKRELAKIPSCYVPDLHGDALPEVGKATQANLPAHAAIRTPHAELSNMFLLEAERGCHRQCEYCVMRRSTNGGMRLVPMETILGLIPDDAKRVGLVGAAVSDHPKIADIVETLADQGREVGLSSLRPDRLNDRFVAALKRAGYRTLTTASDGASQRLRDAMQRRAREKHIERAAELARAHGMKRLKLYMMVGLPGERDDDIDELVEFGTELSKIVPVSLGIAPFVAKRNTPLDGSPFAGIKTVDGRLKRLRRGLKGRVDLRATSARWAWIEYVLAQGGAAEGEAVLSAVDGGGTFRDYERAFAELPRERPRRALAIVS
ncbi:MAG: radical SAM protein [Sandaracinaceae bacterium]